MMKQILITLVFALVTTSFATEEKSSGWSDIKSGSMKIFRGASKGVKKAADKIDSKIEANQKEDEAEEKAERQSKKKR